MISQTKRRALQLIHGAIVRLWVHPLEALVIPYLEQKDGWLPTLLTRLAAWCANVGRILVLDVRLNVVRWIGPDWSLAYIGNGTSLEAVCFSLFPAAPQVRMFSRAFLWQVPALVEQFAGEGDLVVCELNQIIHLSPAGIDLSFTAPQLVEQVIEKIDRPLDEVMADIDKDVRKRINRLERQGYSYVPTKSQEDFDLFYHRMYLPYVQARFGRRGAVIRDYDYVRRFFRQGMLILVKQHQEPICGGLCHLAGEQCEALQMGVLDGRYDLVKQGSNVALWWFVMLWARQHGVRKYLLGTSLPLIANGVFTFKRQWGARVYRDKSAYTQWSFFGKNISTQLREFLNRQGFITEARGEHYRVLLLDPAQPLDEVKLAESMNEAAKNGLAGIVTMSAQGERRVMLPEVSEHPPAAQSSMALQA